MNVVTSELSLLLQYSSDRMLEHRTTTSLAGDIQKKTSVPAKTDKIAL